MTFTMFDLVIIILCAWCLGAGCICFAWLHSIEMENKKTEREGRA